MARRTTRQPPQNPISLNAEEAAAEWEKFRPRLPRQLLRAIKTMPMPSVAKMDDPPAGFARPTGEWIKRSIAEDPRILDRIHRKVETDFEIKVAQGLAWKGMTQGLLTRITQRAARSVAKPRARQLLRLVRPCEGRDVGNVLPSADASPEANVVDRDLVVRIKAEVERLSYADQVLFNGRTAEIARSYKDLGQELGKSPGSLRKRFHDLCDQIALALGIRRGRIRSTKRKRNPRCPNGSSPPVTPP